MGSATPFTSATNMPNGAAGAVDTAQVAIDKARETAGAAADAMGAEASHLADQAREYAERAWGNLPDAQRPKIARTAIYGGTIFLAVRFPAAYFSSEAEKSPRIAGPDAGHRHENP